MRVLVIDAEEDHRRLLAERLVAAGYACHSATDAQEALLGDGPTHDVVLCDKGLLPHEAYAMAHDGQPGASRSRVIVMGIAREGCAKESRDGLVRLLQSLARAVDVAAGDQGPIACFGLVLEPTSLRGTRDGIDLRLTPTEYRVLECLAMHPGQVVRRRALCDHVWSRDWVGLTNVVDVYVSRVRRKVDRDFSPKLVHTVRGVGYRLEPRA
jgi:two-component system OmpR family response regulator